MDSLRIIESPQLHVFFNIKSRILNEIGLWMGRLEKEGKMGDFIIRERIHR